MVSRRMRRLSDPLAHHGVLFLDELPEFNRRSLEVLRQPLEEGHVTISRALHSSTFPASFILVAAMNPCPCGYPRAPTTASCASRERSPTWKAPTTSAPNTSAQPSTTAPSTANSGPASASRSWLTALRYHS
jgi:hypothetical protein